MYSLVRHLNLLILLQALVGCGPIMFDRSFLGEMNEGQEEPLFSPGNTFQTVSGDTGQIGMTEEQRAKRTPEYDEMNPEYRERVRIQKELHKKLSKLSPEQQVWFDRHRDLFESDSQKVYFLSLSESEREEYLYSLYSNKRQVNNSRKPASYFKYSPRDSRIIARGMLKEDVVTKWGNPHRVDIAGDPRLENERWTFFEAGERRVVYFERGRVDGWVTE